MKKKNFIFKVNSILLAMLIFCSMIPGEIFDGLNLSELFSFLFTNVSAADGTEYHNGLKEGVTPPECEFIDELYDGSDAISPLPKYEQYIEQTDYQKPLRISLTDFKIQCGEGLDFNSVAAKKYMDDGYKLMICDAEELYDFSMIVNGLGSSDEIAFYLSANIVLGNNIEYTEMSYDEKFFRPIGNDSNPFTGTFDGQSFEIRDLYFYKGYKAAAVAFFGVVGADAKVENFGLFHPMINTSNNSSTYTAGIAAKNSGTIDSVYVIAEEYNIDGTPSVNAIVSANALYTAGLVAFNNEGGMLSNSYFAGMLAASVPTNLNPVCAGNNGTITNCYYDGQVFACGLSGSTITSVDGKITPLNNIDLKKMNGMTDTKFKILRAAYNVVSSNKTEYYWQYPRLYGFTGQGTKDDPFLISTPADLIYFPNSAEYCSNAITYYYYYRLANCIDMNEVAPYAYQPSLNLTFYSNYKNGNKYIQTANSRNYNQTYFFGDFSGAAVNDEENCPIHHVHSDSTDADGNALQECHCILNLTINRPAKSNDANKRYTAFIPQAYSYNSSDLFPTVHDLYFIGGEISSGDTDCMPSSYNSISYNVCTATVIGYSSYADMYNVHSSATVKSGTGQQYSVRLGGLMASGNFHRITDCTNSGDIIGGYVDMPGEVFLSENYQIGGLLGGATANSNLQDRYNGRIIHCANYGNIYSFEVVTDEDNDWMLNSGACYAAGITTNTLSLSTTGNTSYNPTGASSYYFDDSKRGGRNANFGMIFDGPITLNENGEPLFDEDGKPVALPLPDGKKNVANESPLYYKYMYGIGGNVICNAYNGANIYSVMSEKTHIAGIGECTTAYSASSDQYYNFLNYNKGNIYMYVGGCEAFGIADRYAYQCYNEGDILAEGKIITASTYGTLNTTAGCFAGVSGESSKGCYNKGNIYIAPSERALINSTANSNNISIAVSGVSIKYANGMEKTVGGEKVLYKTINNGTVTVDLATNHFDPVKNTTNVSADGYYPRFSMSGTGMGSYNENYGTFDFKPNPDDTNKMVYLRISACGSVFDNANHSERDLSHCVNYSDIYVDTTEAKDCLYYLWIAGLGINSNSGYRFSDNINLGDISFKGHIQNTLNIRTLGNCIKNVSNCVNLGNVNIDESSVITGTSTICDVYCSNNSTNLLQAENLMLGWYKGCDIPGDTIEEEFKDFFDELDSTKRYGQKNISGEFQNVLNIIPVYVNSPASTCVKSAKKIYNNGEINVDNVCMPVYKTHYVHGISQGSSFVDCINNAPIKFKNVYCNGYCYIRACAAGKNNLNNADIDISNTVTGNYSTFVEVFNSDYTAEHCENRGNITIHECRNATVLDKDYTVSTDSVWHISGISRRCSSCINFGDIKVSEVNRCNIGGVAAVLSDHVSNCLNYGDISCDNSGGYINVGGIIGSTNGIKINKCFNFAKVSVTNPTSYLIGGGGQQPIISMGGVAGKSAGTSSITSCANYGEVVYNNTKGENTNSTNYENTRTSTNFYLGVGGVVGYDSATNVKSCLNYADVKVIDEPNANTMVGGIVGIVQLNNGTLSNNLINYGNVTAPDANATTKNYVCVGGIAGSGYSSGNKRIKYAINYGTVNTVSETASNTFVGSIIGASNNATNNNYIYNIDLCLDMSDPPAGSTYYPLIGGRTNQSNKGTENYTKNESSVNDTQTAAGGKFGTVTYVTLDKDKDIGVFSANFPYRSNLSTEVADSYIDLDTNTEDVTLNKNLDNLLVYQDFKELSPYLQSYMVSHFGEQIKNQGAYVVLSSSRPLATSFVPSKIVSENVEDYPTEEDYNNEMDKLPGLRGTFFGDNFLKGKEVNSLYSALVPPNERTIASDYNIYQQQIDKSSIAEVYNIGAETEYPYYNSDTSFYQKFYEYQNLVETHPAVAEDGKVSDTVIYTDINIYFAIDDIDANRARKDDEDFETNSTIYLKQSFNNVSKKIGNYAVGSTVQYYQGDTMDTTDRILDGEYLYTDEYPAPWLTCDNLEAQLAISGYWGANHVWNDPDVDEKDNTWEMSIPFTGETDTKNVYTKVMCVVTAEDGIHKNIVVAHVIIDYYKPRASVNSVTLTNPDNAKVTSTVDNNLLKEVDKQPSLTDKNNDVPVNDVSYYYVQDNNDSETQNIQRYQFDNLDSPPLITIDTDNIDTTGYVRYRVTYQDRIPGENEKYNELKWNDNITDSNYITEDIVHPTNIIYDQQKKIKSTVTINLGKYFTFYGGLYKVELFYERTKNSKTEKHFATIFFAKQHSWYNIMSNIGISNVTRRYPMYDLPNQALYDDAKDESGNLLHPNQTGYFSITRQTYNNTAPQYYYYSRNTNDAYSNTNSYRGYYYPLKAYIADKPKQTFYLDTDNPIYDNLPEGTLKGRAVTLTNSYNEIYVYNDEDTGAYYPQIFKGKMDIMAENGDIRTFTRELVQNGSYGDCSENDYNTMNYNNAPNIYQSAATKNGYPIIKSEDNTYVGIVTGEETEDVKFTCTWTSSNVTLYHNSNRPDKSSTIYAKDGYQAANVNIYFTPIGSDTEQKLTDEQILEYFNGEPTVTTGNAWTIQLKNSAPVGDYRIVPYMTYHMDLSPFTTGKIKLFDVNDSNTLLEESENNIFGWKIPYTPFVIKNIPNDDSYMTEFHESQSPNTPFMNEDSTLEGSENRSVSIRTASENGEIVYSKSYDSVKTGDQRVDKFNIYAFVGKEDDTSNLRMKAPYLAEMYKWTGTGEPDPNDKNLWELMEKDEDSDTDFKVYHDTVQYNAKDPVTNDRSFEKSVTYYKILAEDRVTYTIYQVEVIPGVRNKETTLEIAQNSEFSEIKGDEDFKENVKKMFEESDKLYQEILANNGTVTATIKELGGAQILYQTKIFENQYEKDATEPYIYNLKCFVFDISVDLPAEYDYDIYNFSVDKDSYTLLTDSKNGYSGKELILNNSDDQTLNLRIVIKRAQKSEIWGVQYLWDYGNAVADESGKILSGVGGKFYNYVYKREE